MLYAVALESRGSGGMRFSLSLGDLQRNMKCRGWLSPPSPRLRATTCSEGAGRARRVCMAVCVPEEVSGSWNKPLFRFKLSLRGGELSCVPVFGEGETAAARTAVVHRDT